MRTLPRLAVTALGLGYLRPAPGTWGSLPPVVLAFGLVAAGTPIWTVNVALILCGLAGAVACWRFGAEAEAHFGKKDPSFVVADEVAGQSIALLLLPWGDDLLRAAIIAATAFLAFRAFDILKPPPAREIQSRPGGAGILLDDLVAGGYALALTQLVARVAT